MEFECGPWSSSLGGRDHARWASRQICLWTKNAMMNGGSRPQQTGCGELQRVHAPEEETCHRGGQSHRVGAGHKDLRIDVFVP